MITTITLNPALDKLYLINDFQLHKLHRLGDLIRTGTTAGGKGINVAIFLNRLGVESNAMGFIGGHTGRIVEEMVREEKVTTNFVFVENETRIDITVIDEKNNTLTEVNESGPPVFQEDIEAFLQRFERILDGTKLIILSGSIPPNAPSDIYATLINMANQRNIKTIINAAKTPLEAGIEAGPTIVYPDMRSAYNMYGKKTESVDDYINLAKLIKSKNSKIETVIFTNPVRDIFVAAVGDKIYEAKITDMKIVNLFGFGDALVGGLSYAINNNESSAEILRYGLASGLVNVESIKKQTADIEKIKNALIRIKLMEI
ncbi:MAG: 1-phosphofructokinase family hexose kinase [Candidatus Margulisiibacteriota bacterium]